MTMIPMITTMRMTMRTPHCPFVAPPSCHLIVLDGCCVDSRRAAILSTHHAALSAIEAHTTTAIACPLRCQTLHPCALTMSHHRRFCHRHHRQPHCHCPCHCCDVDTFASAVTAAIAVFIVSLSLPPPLPPSPQSLPLPPSSLPLLLPPPQSPPLQPWLIVMFLSPPCSILMMPVVGGVTHDPIKARR